MKIIVSGKRKELTDGLTAAQLIGSETTVRPRYVQSLHEKSCCLKADLMTLCFKTAIRLNSSIREKKNASR